jgi:hypothetical protein
MESEGLLVVVLVTAVRNRTTGISRMEDVSALSENSTSSEEGP